MLVLEERISGWERPEERRWKVKVQKLSIVVGEIHRALPARNDDNIGPC